MMTFFEGHSGGLVTRKALETNQLFEIPLSTFDSCETMIQDGSDDQKRTSDSRWLAVFQETNSRSQKSVNWTDGA